MTQTTTINALILAGTHIFEANLDGIPGRGDHVQFDEVADQGGELVSGSFVVMSRKRMFERDRSYVLIDVSASKGLLS